MELSTVEKTTDPSRLTTAQILREIFNLKEIIETRLNGYDSAINLLQDRADKSPSIDVVDQNVTALKQINDEKFNSIKIQFAERDTRSEQASIQNKVAIDAALSAQKESVDKQNISNALAINKSEASFIKQIDQLVKIIDTLTKSFDDKINDAKERIGAIEGKATGVGLSGGVVGAVIGVLLGMAALAIAYLK